MRREGFWIALLIAAVVVAFAFKSPAGA